jgi:predicted house-cleaning noncanonical NTP pyrophosphatase (MazG superfamily)
LTQSRYLQPQSGVWVVSATALNWIEPAAVTLSVIGAKAFGLCCLPSPWTLPLFVVGPDLFRVAVANAGSIEPALSSQFIEYLDDAALRCGMKADDLVMVRSSALLESVEARGKYFSTAGRLSSLSQLLARSCLHLQEDAETSSSEISFIVQQHANPLRLKGHLSNERRLVEEARDWVFEISESAGLEPEAGRIAIRPWREGRAPPPQPLHCQYQVSITEVLREPAKWAHSQSARIHFEWVWDGKTIYLVQADVAVGTSGVDPTRIFSQMRTTTDQIKLQIFRVIEPDDGKKFSKVKNLLTYRALDIPTADLYILDKPTILADLARGIVAPQLHEDLRQLTSRSLVLRTDLATDQLELRQLLPRSDEVRSVEAAERHLIRTLQDLTKAGCVVSELCVLAHHFIPAVTSAWSYAEPRARKVFIEALWGIPEGLYYYSHDTFEVDTLHPNVSRIGSAEREKFRYTARPHYKHHFVAPTATGEWKTQVVVEPFDWRLCIRRRQWIRQIAYQSRLIADAEGYPVSVMWFIELPKETGLPAVLPWYHEKTEQRPQTTRVYRKKFVTDRDHYVESVRDIEELEQVAELGGSNIKRIRVRPKDENLLRQKDFAIRIGEIARALNAVVVLEGGLLSHTYYILKRTGAQVETIDDSPVRDVAQDFNKVVRDLIPDQIASRGERVTVSVLKGDQLVQALKTKLVEEAYEGFDANRYEAFVEELADVLEVVEALRQHVGVSKAELKRRQTQKRNARGGFEKGYVLVDTINPSIAHSQSDINDFLTDPAEEIKPAITNKPPSLLPITMRSTDMRVQGDLKENLLKLEVALTADRWEATTGDVTIRAASGDVVNLRARLVAVRHGSSLRLELTVDENPRQFKLDFDTGSSSK